MTRILFFALLGAAAWFWWHSMQARENARQAAKRECERYGLTLIDDTVERVHLGFGRAHGGGTTVVRVYQFEFTPNGARRYKGLIRMRGTSVEDVKMEPYSVD
ncbi:MAG: DUF3301 domain-containing protein [Pseudomonadota bacterium]